MATMHEINLKVNMTYGDSNLSEEDANDLILFVLWGVILPLVALVGLVGNVLTMMVLWRKEMNSTTILYMRGLVVTDTGILIGVVITLTPISLINYLNDDGPNYFKDVISPRMYAPGFYFVMLLQQINVWITVSVSVERYIAICHPFRAARFISKRKTLAAMLGITIFSIFYNLPHLFASETVSCNTLGAAGADTASGNSSISNNNNNTSSINVTRGVFDTFEYSADTLVKTNKEFILNLPSTPKPTTPSVENTTSPSVTQQPDSTSECLTVTSSAFGLTPFYHYYRSIMYLIIIYVLPFIALVFLNGFLIRELMSMQKRNANIGSKEENEANLSLVLILIVIVFIFCQTPGLISQFEFIPPSMFITWLGVSNLLFATNSAVNFLIYTAFGKKFRRVLLRVFQRLSNSASKQMDKRRRASSASSCHAGLTQYSITEAPDAVEMCPPSTKRNGAVDGNGVSPNKSLLT